MINQSFVERIERTEKAAQSFFEFNPSLTSPGSLIKRANDLGILDDPEIDGDLFKHLMRKYRHIGY